MKAICIHAFGDPTVLQLEDVPRPEPSADQVLIRVMAAAVNPIDWKTRQGQGVAGLLGDTFPHILGWDVSGVVEAVGANVNEFAPGDTVFGMLNFPNKGAAYAAYACAAPDHIAPKPARLDHIQAGAVPMVALTAWQSLVEAANIAPGERVLIHAAAGGVGHMAVQLAKWRGAIVIATASQRHAEFLQRLGVDEHIDYTTTRFEDAVSGVDVVMDYVGGDTLERSYSVLKPGGRLITIAGQLSEEQASAHQVTAQRVVVRPNAAHLREIAGLIDAGHLMPEVGAVFPPALAVQAHALCESRHLQGKVVLDMQSVHIE